MNDIVMRLGSIVLLFGLSIPVAAVQVCSGQNADNTGVISASAPLQACIDATVSGGVLEIPAGVYSITAQLKITKPMTLRTFGLAGSNLTCLADTGVNCATLKASSGFTEMLGIHCARYKQRYTRSSSDRR